MIEALYIDLFCGAGGTTTGVEQAKIRGGKCAKVIACVNHDPNAIASHQANHSEVKHFTEDIRTLDTAPLVSHLQVMRERYPSARVVLWASLECTNFSRAKGGLPRDADSRTLADHLFRYIEALRPDVVQIENVEEFMSWGDLDEHGKPLSTTAGSRYVRWVQRVCGYGYDYDYRILNSADFGAYTSRRRFFGQFVRQGLHTAFPMPTHSKKGGKDLFGTTKKWKAVREVLDLEDDGESIFARKKPLVEKTLERIYAGLLKFVAGGKDQFLLKYNSMSAKGVYHAPGLDDPCPVIATQNRLGKAKVLFLSKQFGGDPKSKNTGVDIPAGTITTIDHHAFITAYYGNGFNASLDVPSPTVTTKDRLSVCFLDSQYGNGTPTSPEAPSPTLCTNPKQAIVSCRPWIMDTSYSNVGSSIDAPSGVITANRKWQYLMNPQFASAGGGVDSPCFTLIASMNKRPPYLVQAEEGRRVGIVVYDDDSPTMRKIKEFMACFGIVDIRMRMLKVDELKKIMGFPEDYVLIGTQAEQKKYIGNAVEVNMSRALCESLCESFARSK